MSQRAWDAQFRGERGAPPLSEAMGRTALLGGELEGEADEGRPTLDRLGRGLSASEQNIVDGLTDPDSPTEVGAIEEMLATNHPTALRPRAATLVTPATQAAVVEEDTETLDGQPPIAGDDGAIEIPIEIATPKPTPSHMRPVARKKARELPEHEEAPAKESVWDAVEVRYRDEGHWGDLVEMYLQRVEGTRDTTEKGSLFKRIGIVMRDELDDPQQALDAFVEALLVDPEDGEARTAIEDIVRPRSWWGELLATVKRELANVNRERQVALCELAMRWAEHGLGSKARGEPFLDHVRRVDPGHPALHKRLAAMYVEQGALDSAREALERAMLRARDDGERLELYLALGAVSEKRPDGHSAATSAYEAALLIEPKSMSALQGLERICRQTDKSVELVSVLEQQIAAADGDDERIDVYIRLADVYERRFVKPQLAAARLEDALAIDPKHEGLLVALERCYQATRSWPDLVRVLDLHAKAEESTAGQIAVVVRAAEILELKMDDAAAAVAAWLRVYDMDPSSERALAELARLSERTSDWPAAAAYRSKLADLAPSPEASAKIHVAIADMLSSGGRDAALARVHYEKAASINPATTEAWEALEKEARRVGDSRRAMMFLEKRAASCDAPRTKGQLFVELASMHKDLGDVAAAELAYERALKADPTNETAAESVLATMIRERRWAEAQPLCEMLAAGPLREGGLERQFMLLRLATRIATELGQKDRSVTASVAAYRARPTLETAVDAIDALHAACDEPAIVAKAAADIDAFVELAMEFSPAHIAKLARIKRALGHDESALALYSKALTLDAELRDALAGIAELLVAREDWERACAFKQKLAHSVSVSEEQYGLLIEVGEMWAHRAKNVPMAALAYEEALAIKPRDSWLLHTLIWVYGELQCWEKLIETLRVVVEIHEDPTAKAKSLFAMAMVVRDHLGDLRRAAQLLEETLDLDPARLDAFERIVRVHTELRDWMELKHAYGRMLRRLRTDSDEDLKHALFFQLGIIYRDRLGDAARALDSFRAAQRVKPDAVDVRKGMVELFVVTDQLDEGVGMLRGMLRKHPQDVALYAELYELLLRKRSFDRAWCAVDALVALGTQLDGEKARFYNDYPPPALSKVPGTLTAGAWRSHILHKELDPALTAIFALVAPAVLRARLALVPFQALRQSLGEPLRPTGVLQHEVMSAVSNASEILSFVTPSLHVRNGTAPLSLAPAKSSLFVSLEACEALPTDALAFVVGKKLAEMRPELVARTLCPSVSELKALVALAVQLSEPHIAVPSTGSAAFDRAIANAVTREERAGLRAAISAAKAQGSELDVARWSQLAEISAARVGLLLSGRIDASKRGMHGDPRLPGDLSPKEKLSELLLFSVSEEYAELRGAIGVGVESNAAA